MWIRHGNLSYLCIHSSLFQWCLCVCVLLFIWCPRKLMAAFFFFFYLVTGSDKGYLALALQLISDALILMEVRKYLFPLVVSLSPSNLPLLWNYSSQKSFHVSSQLLNKWNHRAIVHLLTLSHATGHLFILALVATFEELPYHTMSS